MIEDPTPEFIEAASQYSRLRMALGNDHPQTREQFTLLLHLAPQSFKDDMHAMADQMGLLPKSSGYLENGEPLYRIEDIAAHFNIPMEQANAMLNQMEAERQKLGIGSGIAEPPLIHRKQ